MRLINIELYDSHLAYDNFSFTKPSLTVSGRNPLKQIESDLIKYDMDSEEELDEFLGEDLEDDE